MQKVGPKTHKFEVDADGFIIQGFYQEFHLMHMAVIFGDSNYIEENKQVVNVAEKDHGLTPLHIVISYKRPVAILKTLIRCNADIDANDKYNNTPLMCACRNEGREKHIELLLAHKADVNVRSIFGDTPIMAAAWNGTIENIRLLIDGGAEIGAVQTGEDIYRGKSAIDMCDNSVCIDLLERARKFQESA
ncbi:MAG: ankyrin repeat domain-containing protein [Patescibacteria group bacterium]|nr:ankyrin repeat domain-containing protein [Patescibacteria group bacterium]